MPTIIKINPNGGIITVNIDIKGLVIAGYYLQIFEANSNNVIGSFSGTNQFTGNDNFALPNAASQNVGRVLFLDCSFISLDLEAKTKTCTITLEVSQSGQVVGSASETFTLSKKTQHSIMLIKLA